MSHILNQIAKLEVANRAFSRSVDVLHQAALKNAANDAMVARSLNGKIVLDPSKDPDPYGLHGIPIVTRLQYMGWT